MNFVKDYYYFFLKNINFKNIFYLILKSPLILFFKIIINDYLYYVYIYIYSFYFKILNINTLYHLYIY